ncbi:glycosyltransferase family 2 protein [Komagataeibacter xylinus]|uniref:Glycosyltransferase family 2 protein n=1 Tax=Komagataeibacter xylinus TaxID=28448 RepID=A0A857FP47_KOMXY|nr:glycosyltransferase family 2 protein [Komagataeibacter xylinus]QHC35289.1 glycosyltransferase family 2 protein [Komagataeibacter xylinus]
MEEDKKWKICVIIPSYKVKKHIINVINSIGREVYRIYVIDDACPEESGNFVEQNCVDPRVAVIRHKENQGVGGAVLTGYQAAINDHADIIVKIDGDGQMDPALITKFIEPIVSGKADYTKGNRFFDLDSLGSMPKIRIFGNAALSFMTKLSSGYWSLFDPTNGYTAIRSDVAAQLPFSKINKRYFFESDMLFRLNTLRSAVADIPMDAKYGDEVSNLHISKIIFPFVKNNLINFIKRIFYNYYLRDMAVASFELPIGILLIVLGLMVGIPNWIKSLETSVYTSAGTVMLSGLPLIVGVQFLLSFISYDINSEPKTSMRPRPMFSLEYDNGAD